MHVFYTQFKKFYRHVTNYDTYKLPYNTTKTMLQGARYRVYPAAFLTVIKSFIKLHLTITEKGIIEYKSKMKIQAKEACNQMQ